MKRSLLLLITASCLVLPALTHADTPTAEKQKPRQAAVVPITAKSKRSPVVYYISKDVVTGSLIPVVWRADAGHTGRAASPSVYGPTQINATGALNVSSALYLVDPSISLTRGR